MGAGLLKVLYLTFKQLCTNFFIGIEALFDYFEVTIFAYSDQ
jgi:hypothetical protein